MKIGPVEANFFHVDGQTDMAKLTDACCNFENTPKKYNTSKAITMVGIYIYIYKKTWMIKINQHTYCCIRPSSQIQQTQTQ
jgi:hypothetical protein